MLSVPCSPCNPTTFKDFLPECRDPGGLFTSPVYETFRNLIDRANDWLRANRKWDITTCESVEFKAKGEHVDTENMTYLEYGEVRTWYIRGLRLWLTERENEREKELQIGFLNLIPNQVEGGGIFKSPTYESLDEVINRFNLMLHNDISLGRIITVETQEMKMSNYHELDPDRSNWMESGKRLNRFLFVVRIFHEIEPKEYQQIGIKDFIPDSVSLGGIFSLPDYEPFSNVVQNVSHWCREQVGIRLCNAQSLEIKVKKGKNVDTQKMDYTEHGRRMTFYVRILRVCYITAVHYSRHFYRTFSVNQFTCRTFVPVQLTTGICVPEYETLSKTKERVSAWVRATGARVISAETAALRLMTGGEARHGAEATSTYNRAERSEYWIYVIRLYLDGAYTEPPLDVLPPIPEMESQCCCAIL